MKQFAHLHNHTHMSLLDGHGTPDAFFSKAAELGMSHLSITDHGSLSGLYKGWEAGKKHGVKFIAGIETYIAPVDRRERTSTPGFSGSGKYGHLTLLAKGSHGLRNLYRLQADAHTTGFYGKPRIDLSSLADHASGLICLTGCAAGHLSIYLRQGEQEKAYDFAGKLKTIFRDDLYVELMSHGIEIPGDLEEGWLNEQLINLARVMFIPTVATNDSHHCTPEDFDVQQALLCVSTQGVLSDPNRFRFNGSGFHLRSAAEMYELGLPEEALRNTVEIAEQIGDYDDVFAYKLSMPRYSDDEGYDLDIAANHGLLERNVDKLEYAERLGFELDIINSMGFAGYFLTLKKVLDEGRKRGMLFGPGRGSAGGSLVAFALGITDLDPIAHNLIFERFLNPSRVSLPDIDIDVAEQHRQPLIDLVREMYGDDHVAIIGTFSTIKANAALKDANRVLGGTFTRGAEYCSHLPPAKFGVQADLSHYSGEVDDAVRLARGLEGTVRGQGQHAAGVLISPVSLVDVLPLWHPAGQDTWVTGFDMHEVEKLGQVKLDFLGLRNLGVIDECRRMLQSMDIDGISTRLELPLLPDDCNDLRTYELLARGDTLGVFQLDSPGMRGLLRLLRPTCFDDISSVLALYRPGPMGANAHVEFAHRKNKDGGRWQSDWAIHPEFEKDLKPVLEETYGLIVFQEQVLAALKVVCGWSYAEAGLLFDAMRKKKHDKMAETRPAFEESGKALGYSIEALTALWDVLVPFADYSFNRCISGSTTLTKSSKGRHDKTGEITVKELYDIWNGPRTPMRNKLRARSTGLKVMARDSSDGRIRPDRIVGVYAQGTQKLYRVTLSNGMSIDATENHRHLTDSGWKRVDQLSVGGLVATMGGPNQQRCTSEGSGNTVGIHNGLHLLRREIRSLGRCEACGHADGRLEIAHLDSDRTNNPRSNLKLLCNPRHKKLDYSFGSRKKRHSRGRDLVFMEIISIEYIGEEETYDVEMKGEDHSFVGNGIVTHNSHTAGYGLIAYWTAYLKANHPVEYMAALLSSVTDDPDKLHEYLAECQKLGIELLPPDINISGRGFTPDGDSIRYGLSAIKGVGEAATEAIESQRPYQDLTDFLRRCPGNALNAGVFAALVKAGALDRFGYDRPTLLGSADWMLTLAAIERSAGTTGQPLLVSTDYSPRIHLREETDISYELETLGVQLSFETLRFEVTGVLSENDIEYIRRTVAGNSGAHPVELWFGTARFKAGRISQAAVGKLLAVDKLKI